MSLVKTGMKTAMDLLMKLLSLPCYLSYCLGRCFLGERKAFSSMMQWMSLFPGTVGEWYRRGLLQWVTGREMKDACICFETLFSDPEVRIGDGVYIGPRCDIGKVTIGKNTIISSNVQVLSGLNQHRYADAKRPIKDQGGVFDRVSIGEDCWIGSQSLIGADLGKRCIIGAGSVVVKPVPDHSVVCGNPAKVVRSVDEGNK